MANSRIALVLLHDTLVAMFAWFAAFWLRFNGEIPAEQHGNVGRTILIVLVLQPVIFWIFGLYRGMWRYASLPDLSRLIGAAAVGALAVPAAIFMLLPHSNVPRSVAVLYPLLLVLLSGGSRFAYRAWKDGSFFDRSFIAGTPVLILGAGEAGVLLLRELAKNRQWNVVGLLDDDSAKQGRHLVGSPVLGPIVECSRWAEKFGARHAIVAMPSATAGERRRAAEAAVAAGLSVMTVPAVADLLAGNITISQVRKVELEDLLGREKMQLDDEGLQRLLAGKVILVTGAGGSIGAELCRQIMRFRPQTLVFYELSELALYRIEQEFEGKPVACRVGDVKDEARLDAVFLEFRPDVIFHAAAYKHVPLMEGGNAWQAVRNNVLGTWRVARAAQRHGAGEFVLISTDKAVNPTNVMGATKRLAERVCEALQRDAGGTRIVMVRFGNVLGSSGSVIPKFRDQIAKGGPVTVTHPDIIRYFMLIPEAAQLVLQAALQGNRGEIFVLDMGEPVRIVDLARDMIRLSGFTEDDIKIEFTGLRPGEKLYEELLADGEATLPTPHPKLRVMKAEQTLDAAWLIELEEWLAVPVRSEAEVKEGLQHWVPEYRPANH
jgi:FlaA1/EpsC-like NDP-sugar epimerase